jgi:hypothetical protein
MYTLELGLGTNKIREQVIAEARRTIRAPDGSIKDEYGLPYPMRLFMPIKWTLTYDKGVLVDKQQSYSAH